VATIELTTVIAAPRERCFDLARSIDLHLQSTSATGETAVAGRTSGLIEMGEEVTWRARHFGVWQHFTSRITAYDRPAHFRDSMTRGAFRSFEHDHFFTEMPDGRTRMRDVMVFHAPLGPLGRLVEKLGLTRYLTRFLANRNRVIRQAAESGVDFHG
jgi:ligand-binding SRPBCC domain-containing protein